MSKKVVLAYSGGLDTSVILRVLQQRGYEVVAFLADVGQGEDFAAAEAKAKVLGASEVFVEDLKRRFVEDFVYPSLAANAVYENRYLLGTALARPLIGAAHVEVARRVGGTAVAHGATGKGNDQVRFEMAYAALAPDLEVIAPWKEPEFLSRFEGRSDLLRFAEQEGIPVSATSDKPYSTDENLLHRSYEAGVLEHAEAEPPPETFGLVCPPWDAPDRPVVISLEFRGGRPVRLADEAGATLATEPVELLARLNTIAGENGVGRIDMVENRFVGIKSRGVYETPGGTVIHFALRDLEGLVLDREVLSVRDDLSRRFARLVYNGFWWSPEMRVVRAGLDEAARGVEGEVRVRLYRGSMQSAGRSSARSLYDARLSSMDIGGGYDQTDARGFIRLHALRLSAWSRVGKGAT